MTFSRLLVRALFFFLHTNKIQLKMIIKHGRKTLLCASSEMKDLLTPAHAPLEGGNKVRMQWLVSACMIDVRVNFFPWEPSANVLPRPLSRDGHNRMTEQMLWSPVTANQAKILVTCWSICTSLFGTAQNDCLSFNIVDKLIKYKQFL